MLTVGFLKSSTTPSFTSMELGIAISYKVNLQQSPHLRLTMSESYSAFAFIGKLGDCWFLSAIAAVGTKSGLVEKLCVAVSCHFVPWLSIAHVNILFSSAMKRSGVYG
jgi:hypothetical protein